jgi:tetratricopeptide (TPR) repeat protein
MGCVGALIKRRAISTTLSPISATPSRSIQDPSGYMSTVASPIATRATSTRSHVDQAIADFSKAIEIDAQFGDAFVNRCVAYTDKGQADLAIKDCTAAIAINPKDAVAFNDRGVAQEKKGDLDAAIADYSKAIELDPGYGVAYANRAVVYDHKGEKESAIADYRAALAKNPSDEDRRDLEAALQRLGTSP